MSPDETPIHDEDAPFYHVDENGRLTWTDEGLRSYRKRFARFGIRVEAIETYEDYETAMCLSAGALDEQLLAIAGNGPPSLERHALMAIARNDGTEYRRLLKRLKARNRLGLRVVD